MSAATTWMLRRRDLLQASDRKTSLTIRCFETLNAADFFHTIRFRALDDQAQTLQRYSTPHRMQNLLTVPLPIPDLTVAKRISSLWNEIQTHQYLSTFVYDSLSRLNSTSSSITWKKNTNHHLKSRPLGRCLTWPKRHHFRQILQIVWLEL